MNGAALRILGIVVICLALASCTSYGPKSRQASGSAPPAGVTAAPPPVIEDVTEWLYDDAPNVAQGLEVHKRIQRVSFATSSASLDGEARGALQQTLELLKGNPVWKILTVGFADKLGESGPAAELSRKRAAAVKDFLVSQGVDADRVTTMGMGSRYAEGDQYEPTTTASDRRAEIWVFM